jgi:hypothetical protein
MRRSGWLIAAAGAVLSLAASPVSASVGPAPPGLQPLNPGSNGYFEATLSPGQQHSFSVSVKNLGTSTETFQLYPADGTTSSVTGVQYSQPSPPPTGTGSWIKLAATRLTLPGGGEQTVSFIVTVPAGTGAGDHVGAVVGAGAGPATSTSSSTNASGSGVSLSVTSRVVVAVVIHVPTSNHIALQVGTPTFGIESGGRQFLSVPLNDSGDLLFKPHLTGTVTPCGSSAPAFTLDRQLDTFVPHTSIDYVYFVQPTRLPQGCYTVTVRTDDTGKALDSFHGNLQLGPVAAGTATTINLGGSGQAGLTAQHKSSSISTGVTVLIIVAALLGGLVLLLLILLLRRRPKDEEEEEKGSQAPTMLP